MEVFNKSYSLAGLTAKLHYELITRIFPGEQANDKIINNAIKLVVVARAFSFITDIVIK